MDIEALLRELHSRSGSDLHLKVGRPPIFRISGELKPSQGEVIADEDLRKALYVMMGDRIASEFERDLETDFSYELEGVARFRANVFHQRGRIGSVMRLIPLQVPTVEGLGLPLTLNKIAENIDGLVLVTGPTGSGKSTTLAAMIEHINNLKPVHVVTVEDPIEFVYEDKIATINQRELGVDTGSLHASLRAMLRQDPDVILMGEMRDQETIAFGITAAETGHLVFATLHTTNAMQTVERILDTIPTDGRKMVRGQLAIMLRAIVCQHLCLRADNSGRIAALEIMVNSPQISQLLEEGETRSLERAILEGGYYGMQTFNQGLYKMAEAGMISREEAVKSSSNPDDLELMFKGYRHGSGATLDNKV